MQPHQSPDCIVLQPVQVLQQQPGVIKAACAAALAHEAAVYKEVTNAKVRVCCLHAGVLLLLPSSLYQVSFEHHKD